MGALEQIFADDHKINIMLTGAIGTGKTQTAYKAIAYIIYRILNYRDPWGFFRLEPSGKLKIAFFNLTKALSKSKGFGILQDYLKKSPWFLERGTLRGGKDTFLEFDTIDYLLASPYSKGFGMIGEHIIAGVMDEVDSSMDSVVSKVRVLKAYEGTIRRFESRFIIDGTSLGRFFLVASKQDHMSFLKKTIEQQRKSSRTLVFDFAKWEVKSPRDYCGRKFKISLGDKYNKPKILETKEDIADAVTKFKIIEVPIEHKQSFIDDIIGCLTGDTKIPLLSGGFKSIKELVGIKDFYVYSIDSMGKIVPGRAYDVRLTKQKADIYKVVLDNGRCIRCTGNHPFLMRDGSYKEARLLVPKESLMPLYRNLNNKGYERTYVPKYDKYIPTHILSFGRRARLGYVIHHDNFNKKNNDPSNLKEKTLSAHQKIHARVLTDKQLVAMKINQKKFIAFAAKQNRDNNPATWPGVAKKIMATQRKNKSGFYKEGNYRAKGVATRKEAFKKKKVPLWVARHIARSSKQLTAYNTSKEKIEKLKKLYAQGKVGFSLRTKKQIFCQRNNASIMRFSRTCKYCGTFFDNVTFAAYGTHVNACKHPRQPRSNHKVVSVVKDGYADVYDMSVDKYNNFALDAGVFVHNSLRDIGGISSDDVSKRKFIPSETFLHKCYSGEMINPFTMETIMTGLAEPANLSLYFDASKIRMPRDVPWYVHGDWAKNGDAFGLAMSAIAGYTMINVTQENGTIAQKKVPIIETAFVVRVKAYPNDQIPQYTIRDFILALRGLGFHIKRYSSDLDLATTDTRQLLEHAGIKTAYISVDKTPKWYTTFRDMIYEQRWRCFMHSYLHFELANLEQDPETHDIDHPEIVETIAILDDGDAKEVVLEGSKDGADACAGTIANILTAIDDDNPIDIEAMRDIQTKITGAAKHGERVDEIELTRKLIGVHLSDGQRSTKDLSKFRNILKKVR